LNELVLVVLDIPDNAQEHFASLAAKIWRVNRSPVNTSDADEDEEEMPDVLFIRHLTRENGRVCLRSCCSWSQISGDRMHMPSCGAMHGESSTCQLAGPASPPSVLGVSDNDVAWLEVSPSAPFRAVDHDAVLAGTNSFGEKEYIARVRRPSSSYTSPDEYRASPCTATDGAPSVRYKDEQGKLQTATRFDVLVLRFDPADKAFAKKPPSGSVATGHLFWRKFKKREWIEYKRGD